MRSYEEIAASVFEKRDAHEAQRKKRMALIGKCSTVGAGFCCIALIALGFYKGELSDVQEFKEYVGNPTEATTEAVTTQDASSETGSTGGSYSTNAPSADGETTDSNIQTGVMVDDAYLNEDYIYIIQDPTEPPEQQESTTLPNGETVTRPPTGSEATDTTQTETSQGNSNEQATTEDPFLSGGWYDPSDKTESPSVSDPIDPSQELTESPEQPITTTTSEEFLGPTEIVTQAVTKPVTKPVTRPVTQVVTSIVVVTNTEIVVTKEATTDIVTESDTTQYPTIPPNMGTTPLYLTYNKFTLSSTGVSYYIDGSTASPSVVGALIESGVIVMADDEESYVKINVYAISSGLDASITVVIKYQNDPNYYKAYST